MRDQQIREIFDPTKGMSLKNLPDVAFIFPLFSIIQEKMKAVPLRLVRLAPGQAPSAPKQRKSDNNKKICQC